MATSTCPDENEIVRLFDGDLPASARQHIGRHLDQCSACEALVAQCVPPASCTNQTSGGRTPAFDVGAVIAERYRIESLLGIGGMGEVYRVYDASLGERVALKTVRATMRELPSAVARLKTEVQLARRVTHPNVCRTFDFGVHRDGSGAATPFLTMELVAGTTLNAHIRAGAVVSPDKVIAIVHQIAAGLAAAHRVGVIHKDLKSDNVIVELNGTVRAVVTDFGLAAPRDAGPSHRAGSVVSGTPGYVAPERTTDRMATEASDVFSLGIVMLDVLTGRVPAPEGSGLLPSLHADPRCGRLLAIARTCSAPTAEVRPAAADVVRQIALLSTARRIDARWFARAAGALAIVASLAAVAVSRRVAQRPSPPVASTGAAQRSAEPPLSWNTSSGTSATPAPVAPRAPKAGRRRLASPSNDTPRAGSDRAGEADHREPARSAPERPSADDVIRATPGIDSLTDDGLIDPFGIR